MSAILQATVQAAVREAINRIVHLQSQQAAAMPAISAREMSRLVPLFDPTSQCVTIRREDADRIGIKCTVIAKPLTMGGYGSGRVTPCSEANVNLTVDQATADVPVLIVPNESQAIPLIVGQPFTEQPQVTIVRRGNTSRIFEELEERERK
ncbi:hypothetical protein HPB49_015331 [Dermacentor silvarum]|uniref:Uncharacterized protein n=1 Tax=Dermacentor silvarum TaxID=543639 RepID=A0ACB8E0V8_DERSI|nr:hypothetical protein HPB49_015331 [Dermacentor silvarum]